MIKSVEMYTVICDGCGKDSNENNHFSVWSCEMYAQDIAMEEGWVFENDEHYCTDCFEYDDDDNLIIHKGGNNEQQ